MRRDSAETDAHITIVDRRAVREWIQHSRLDRLAPLMRDVATDDAEKQEMLKRMREQIAAASANLPNLMAVAEASAR